MLHSLPPLTGLTLNDVESVGMRAPIPKGMSDELWLRLNLRAAQFELTELTFKALSKWLLIYRGPSRAKDLLVPVGPVTPSGQLARAIARMVLDKASRIKQASPQMSPDAAARAAVAVINVDAEDEMKSRAANKAAETRKLNEKKKQEKQEELLKEGKPVDPNLIEEMDESDAEKRSDTVEL
tara:strand:- start:9 stop:554 length:546 start_codon:yes stop_codon:yes gene_type:complete